MLLTELCCIFLLGLSAFFFILHFNVLFLRVVFSPRAFVLNEHVSIGFYDLLQLVTQHVLYM